MDKQAEFEKVLREHGPFVYSLALRLSGNPEEGDDLAQDVFLKAYTHFENFRGEAQVKTWLYRIAVNCWKNRLRTRSRRSFWKHLSLSFRVGGEDEDAGWELPDTTESIEGQLEKRDNQEALERALAALPEMDRAVLVLCDVQDRPYDEAGTLLGIPLGTVKSRLARARVKLRTQFLKETDGS